MCVKKKSGSLVAFSYSEKEENGSNNNHKKCKRDIIKMKKRIQFQMHTSKLYFDLKFQNTNTINIK